MEIKKINDILKKEIGDFNMYKNELLNTIKEQKKGLLVTKRDYKIVFEQSKKEALEENRQYDYSKIISIVVLDKNSVKFTFTERPSVNISKDHDVLKEFTDYKTLILTMDEVKNLTFVE